LQWCGNQVCDIDTDDTDGSLTKENWDMLSTQAAAPHTARQIDAFVFHNSETLHKLSKWIVSPFDIDLLMKVTSRLNSTEDMQRKIASFKQFVAAMNGKDMKPILLHVKNLARVQLYETNLRSRCHPDIVPYEIMDVLDTMFDTIHDALGRIVYAPDGSMLSALAAHMPANL